jgi:pyruvate, water dikinase
MGSSFSRKNSPIFLTASALGTNDLTQLILGVDRDSESKIGICGQAPSDYPDFAQFLVEQKIDSISLNPDTVMKTTLAILEKETAQK